MAKIGDENFILGGQGLAVEFCLFCTALRVRDFVFVCLAMSVVEKQKKMRDQ